MSPVAAVVHLTPSASPPAPNEVVMRKPYPCRWNCFATGVENAIPVRWEVLLNRISRQWFVRKVMQFPWGETPGKSIPVNPGTGRSCHAATVKRESLQSAYPSMFGGGPPVPDSTPDIAPVVDPTWCDGRVWEMPAVYGLRQALMAYCREHHIRATFPSGGKAAGVTGFYFQAVRGE